MVEGTPTEVHDEVETLVERARARDEDAAVALIEHCERRIVAGIEIAGVARYDSDFEDAQNIALFEIWQQLGRLESVDAICAWMHGIARRVTASRVIDPAVRHRRRVDKVRASSTATTAPDPGAAFVERDLLGRVLGSLSHDHREVLVLRYLEGFSEAETAALLGIGEKTVSSRTVRAKRAAIAFLDAVDGEEVAP